MKPLKTRLLESRERYRLPWEVLERDYLLSWMLAGIARVDVLREILVFKGGTALKKCYFGEYCFSEDLDFTMISAGIIDEIVEVAMQQARNAKVLKGFKPTVMEIVSDYDTNTYRAVKTRIISHCHSVVIGMVLICDTVLNIILNL